MNKNYKSVWNESLGAWVAASETAKGRSKKNSVKTSAAHGISVIALTGAGLAFASASADAAIYNAALFNDFTDGECTAVQDGSAGGVNGHTVAGTTTAGCSAKVGTGASATSIGLNGGDGINGTNFISNQNGAFVNGGLEVFGANGAAGAPVAYVHGSMSLSSDGTTSGTANKLIGLAAGTAGTDAVNVGQLTPVVTALGGGAAIAADGSVTAPTYTLKGTNYSNVGAALSALSDSSGTKYFSALDADGSTAGATATGVGSIAIGGDAVATGSTTDAGMAIGSHARAAGRATALGPSATASAFDSVALGSLSVSDRTGTVSVGNATTQRQIVQVAKGTQATDAVNLSQLTPVVSALGGGAAVAGDGSVTGPTYVIKGTNYTTVGAALTALGDGAGSSKYFHVNSTLADSVATGAEAVSIGALSTSSGANTLAIGRKAISSGSNESIAIGSDVQSLDDDSLSMGSQIVNAAKSSVAIGSNYLCSIANRDRASCSRQTAAM